MELSQCLVSNLFGKRERERSHGGEENGLIRSWSWLVKDESLLRVVLSLLFGGDVGIGGGKDGFWLSLHVFGRRWITALEVGSLLRRIAYLFLERCACRCRGGMEASISNARVGVVLKAAQMRRSAFLCTFSRALAWHLVSFHHEGLAYKILGMMQAL